MNKAILIHPEILSALASSGHGSKILITDGNFPVATNTAPSSVKVFLNLAPGMCNVTDVLSILLSAVPVEKAIFMEGAEFSDVPIHEEFRKILGNSKDTIKLKKEDFYEKAESKQNCLTIVTGDMRRFANIILVMGVRDYSGSCKGFPCLACNHQVLNESCVDF